MFFPNRFPEVIFRGSKCPSILKSAILVRFSIFQGSQNPLRVRSPPSQSVSASCVPSRVPPAAVHPKLQCTPPVHCTPTSNAIAFCLLQLPALQSREKGGYRSPGKSKWIPKSPKWLPFLDCFLSLYFHIVF